jgi:hypothetical protein
LGYFLAGWAFTVESEPTEESGSNFRDDFPIPLKLETVGQFVAFRHKEGIRPAGGSFSGATNFGRPGPHAVSLQASTAMVKRAGLGFMGTSFFRYIKRKKHTSEGELKIG